LQYFVAFKKYNLSVIIQREQVTKQRFWLKNNLFDI